MFKLALFCSFLILVTAKVSNFATLFDLTDPDDKELILMKSPIKLDSDDELSEDLWVLEIDDFLLSSVTLWAGNLAEDKEFEETFGSVMDRYEERQRRAGSGIDPILPQLETDSTDDDDEMVLKGKIMRIVNKFAMSVMTDPDSYLLDTEKGYVTPSLTLYFKGPYSALTVNAGDKKKLYFILPPSPLPRWFYEKHPDAKRVGRTMYVEAPDNVKKEFYKSLVDVLHRFLSVPV